MTLIEQVSQDIRSDEGYSGIPYHDSRGVLTIGWGHNVEDEPLPAMFQEFFDRHGYITQTMAEALLTRDLAQAEQDCWRLFSNWKDVPPEIKRPLLNMAFNLGRDRLGGFEKMDDCVEAGDWAGVAREMKDSKWYREDVPNRARRLVAMVEAYAEGKKGESK